MNTPSLAQFDQPTKITCISWDPARNAVAIYSNPIFTAYYVYEPFNNGIPPDLLQFCRDVGRSKNPGEGGNK